MPRPELAPAIDRAAVAGTVDAIASVQLADGCIPWFPGGQADPWNHTEAAMALSAGGHPDRAEAAYRWLAATQREDGTWAASYRDGAPAELHVDTNVCAYVAAGLWHHTLATGDHGLLEELWPVAERAVDAVLELQTPGGEILWAREVDGTPAPGALLSSSACIHLSLRCALAAAAELGLERPDWELAADRLGHAVAHREEHFLPKRRWSMDWYYPVLGGAVTGSAARVRLAERWDEFIVDRLGCRCVSDRDWVTAAETCELVMALDAIGRGEDAERLLAWVQHHRAEDGAYWTGWVWPENVRWPEEQPTWTSAAVVLAADALLELSPASGFFRALHEAAGEERLAAGSA
jgi:hypothetical protein